MTPLLSARLLAVFMAVAPSLSVHAQNLAPVTPQDMDKPVTRLDGNVLPERIAQERRTLAAQKEAIMQAYDKQVVACWEKFAVNACLLEARRVRRQALDPLDRQDLILNAQERTWRTEQRDKRLQDKQTENRGTP